jgi:putative ABC transport system permease protein
MSAPPTPAVLPRNRPSRPKPARSLIGPYTLLYTYRARLRVQGVQELLAGLGVAIAVALVFATLLANASIAGSAREVVHRVIGPADVQLQARGSEGFSQRLLAEVEHEPGVKQAAAALEASATLVARNGREVTVTVLGADFALAALDGLAHTLPISTLEARSLALTRQSMSALGLSARTKASSDVPVTLALRGHAWPLRVAAVLGPETVGPLAAAYASVMRLGELQRITGLRGRVSRILVQSKPGHEAEVKNELSRLAGGRIAVTAADHDLAVLDQALGPSQLASSGFALVAVLLGFLLAFNAILLTAPERRRAIAELRMAGATRAVIVQVVLFQALCLGVVASAVGLLGGYLLAISVFHEHPAYLSEAFTLGGGTVIGWQPLLIAMLGGIAATCVASLVLLLDLRGARTLDAVYCEDTEPGNTLARGVQRRLGAGAALLLVLATALFLAAPSLALATTALLALATVLLVPLMFASVLRLGSALAARADRLTTLPVALTAIGTTALRSVALMSTGAVALFGAVALAGARGDLLSGLEGGARAYASDAAIWVFDRGDIEQTSGFALSAGQERAIARLPDVTSVTRFQSAFANFGKRRVVIFAHPAGTGRPLLESQLVTGRLGTAMRRIGEGGWIAVAKPIADERHVGVGGVLSLPTPTGTANLRIAALITNFGWPGGAAFINSSDFQRLWSTTTPTALGVDVKRGSPVGRVRAEIASVLGSRGGIEVVSARTWSERFGAVAAAGLNQLREISLLLLIAAILALLGALVSAIWQRRAWVSGLRLSGAKPARLRRALLMESMVTLGVACLAGTALGICAETVLDGYFRRVTGFPASTLSSGPLPVELFAAAMVIALVVAAIPAWLVSRVSPALALEGQ